MIQIIINNISNKVRATLLTGLSLVNSEIAATDTVLQAFGKLQAQIANRVVKNTPITGATKTKVTYDAKGLVTNGQDATTDDIADSVNKRYVTDANLVVLGNISGTNTGNETTSTLGATINGAAAATPNDSDLVATVESSVVKKITWTNVKAFLKTYFDTLYEKLTNKATDFSVLNNILYPSVLAVYNFVLGKTGTTAYITTGNQTTTSNVASDIAGMVVALESNKRYRVDGILRTGCNNTGGLLVGATFPALSTCDIITFGFTNTATSFTRNRIVTSGVVLGVFNTLNNAVGFVFLKGEIETGDNSGNIQFQFASGTNTQTSTIFQTGTWLNFTEL